MLLVNKLRGVDSGRPKVKSLCGLEQWGFCCTVLSPGFYFVQEIKCDNYVVVTGIFATGLCECILYNYSK